MLFLLISVLLPPHSPVDVTLSLLSSVCCTDLHRFLNRFLQKAVMSPPDAGTTFCVNPLKQPSESDTQTVYQSVFVLDPWTETALSQSANVTRPPYSPWSLCESLRVWTPVFLRCTGNLSQRLLTRPLSCSPHRRCSLLDPLKSRRKTDGTLNNKNLVNMIFNLNKLNIYLVMFSFRDITSHWHD